MDLLNDLKLALRSLRKNPGFSAIAILTLALAIGANTAIFSAIYGVMLRPLPYSNQGELVSFWETTPRSPRTSVSPANFMDYVARQRSFSGIATWEFVALNLTGAGTPQQVLANKVTSGFFPVLGVAPIMGRNFLPAEDHAGQERVAILSYELWQRKFGADQAIIGKQAELDGEKYQIVGVLPKDFKAPGQFSSTTHIGIYLPEAWPADLLTQHGDHEVFGIARLRPGVTLAQAQSDFDGITTDLARLYVPAATGLHAGMAPLRNDISRNVTTPLLVLLSGVGVILLIACVNVGNLLLARATGMRREIGVRLALGATRGRIVRDWMMQSGLLALLGCLLGAVLANWGRDLLVTFAPANIPRKDSIQLDLPVLLFAVIVSAASAMLFGLLPAWKISGSSANEAIRSGEALRAAPSVLRLRNVLAGVEIAFSLMLLIGGTLLLRSFIAVAQVDLGMHTEHVLVMNIGLPTAIYTDGPRRATFFEELERRTQGLPGVESVAYTNRLPLRGGWSTGIFTENAMAGIPGSSDCQAVNPGYFPTLGITLLRGRLLTDADRQGSLPVAVVNAMFAHQFFPGSDALGRRFRRTDTAPWVTIVGVVSDIRRAGKESELLPEVYLPAAQTDLYPVRLGDVAVRATIPPAQLVAQLQQVLATLDPTLSLTSIHTMDEIVLASISERRFYMFLLVSFAALAVLLALVGIYGVVSYSVAQRIPEMGIRIALGATARDVLRLILGQSAVMLGAGIAGGVVAALAVSRFLRSMLFAVHAVEPLTYAALAILLALVGLLGCALPARRATKVDPMVALRYE